MKSFAAALLLSLLVAGSVFMIIPSHPNNKVDDLPPLPTEPIQEDSKKGSYIINEFKDEFEASCAIFRDASDDDSADGSGVLLDTGFILTNKHVVDGNKNGFLDDSERIVSIRFFFPEQRSYIGRVLAWPHENWWLSRDKDFVFIAITDGPKSNISLINSDDYKKVLIGQEIMIIGVPAGLTPPHLYIGYRSADVNNSPFHRASASAFWGNSGGGVFLSEKNQLIGLVAAVRTRDIHNTRFLIPQMAEYVPAPIIHNFVTQNRLKSLVDATR